MKVLGTVVSLNTVVCSIIVLHVKVSTVSSIPVLPVPVSCSCSMWHYGSVFSMTVTRVLCSVYKTNETITMLSA